MRICTVFALVVIIFVSACSSDSAATEDPSTYYHLDWKLAEGEIVAYRTALNTVPPEERVIETDGALESTEEAGSFTEFARLISTLQPSSYSMVSLLQLNERGNIGIQMIVNDLEFSEAMENGSSEMLESINDYLYGVQLRGELNPNGGIESFYLEQRQKNLLAMFFELPTSPVAVGDTWEIEVNCLTMGHGFIVETAERTNQVTFSEITTNSEGKPLAVIDYLILETVHGDFANPLSNEVIATSMTCSFIGRGYFLINEGRWENFLGEFSVISTGIMNAENIQQFALTLFDYEDSQEGE